MVKMMASVAERASPVSGRFDGGVRQPRDRICLHLPRLRISPLAAGPSKLPSPLRAAGRSRGLQPTPIRSARQFGGPVPSAALQTFVYARRASFLRRPPEWVFTTSGACVAGRNGRAGVTGWAAPEWAGRAALLVDLSRRGLPGNTITFSGVRLSESVKCSALRVPALQLEHRGPSANGSRRRHPRCGRARACRSGRARAGWPARD